MRRQVSPLPCPRRCSPPRNKQRISMQNTRTASFLKILSQICPGLFLTVNLINPISIIYICLHLLPLFVPFVNSVSCVTLHLLNCSDQNSLQTILPSFPNAPFFTFQWAHDGSLSCTRGCIGRLEGPLLGPKEVEVAKEEQLERSVTCHN